MQEGTDERKFSQQEMNLCIENNELKINIL